jgi:hypothetical protein
MKKLPFVMLTLLVLAACGEVGQSPSLSSSSSSSSSISENGTDGLLFTPSIYDGKEGYLVSGYEGTSKEVIIPNTFNKSNVFGVRSLAFYDPFVGKQIENIVFPENLKFIGVGAFQRNQLTSITIPNSINTISERAFKDNHLTSVTIPDSVTTIGDGAFSDNQLTSVIIPNSVTTIGAFAFSSSQSLTIYVEAEVIPEGWIQNWNYSENASVTIVLDYKNQ